MLPSHGKIECRDCFKGTSANTCQPANGWLMRNDPGTWGSANPEILILGFSKGSTQANIYQNGNFNDVAFGGQARNRLDRLCKSLGVLQHEAHISDEISNPASRFGFGSLVRCSLTREDKHGKHQCSGEIILKSFKEIPDVITRCSQKFLSNLPAKTRIVIFLGVTDRYIKACKSTVANLYPSIAQINDVAYGNDERLFIHATHPSPGNGHFERYLSGDAKFLAAKSAIEGFTRGR